MRSNLEPDSRLPPEYGETFSENYSPTETCRPCTQCKGLLRMKAPCTESADAICVCDYNYYMDKVTGDCQACTLCPLGHGVWTECTEDMDTVCEPCPEGTYSDQESSMDPCLPCTICEDEEYEAESCTLISDSLCKGCLDWYSGSWSRLVNGSPVPAAHRLKGQCSDAWPAAKEYAGRHRARRQLTVLGSLLP
ncbi:UNVERIFIED_CONTAM: hypothetical protein FKN15_042835 [Acipenser sinensis]